MYYSRIFKMWMPSYIRIQQHPEKVMENKLSTEQRKALVVEWKEVEKLEERGEVYRDPVGYNLIDASRKARLQYQRRKAREKRENGIQAESYRVI